MSYSEEESEETISQDEASHENESMAEEVKVKEEAPSQKTEEVNIPAVVVIKP